MLFPNTKVRKNIEISKFFYMLYNSKLFKIYYYICKNILILYSNGKNYY